MMNDLGALRLPYRPDALDDVTRDVRAWPGDPRRIAALRLIATAREANVRLAAALRVVEDMRKRGQRRSMLHWWNPARPSTWSAWWWGRVVYGSREGPGLVSWRAGPVELRRLVP